LPPGCKKQVGHTEMQARNCASLKNKAAFAGSQRF
jgi:hypothetical protein